MALRTGSDLTGWESIFTNAGITMASAKVFAQRFSSEGITRDSMHMLDRTMLKELGTKSMGDVLIILKLPKENPASPTTHVKPTAKPPQLNSEMTPSPEWPFQQIVMDIFHVGHVTYLACADRLTGWLILYHLKPGHVTTSKLMSICRQLFQTYDTPDEISTDAGQPFFRLWLAGSSHWICLCTNTSPQPSSSC